MSTLEQQCELQRILGWIYHRSRNGLFSMKRSARDAALSDINHEVGRFARFWDGKTAKADPNHVWLGERP